MAWILVRFGEIWLKSQRTRKALLARLVENIKEALALEGVQAKIYTPWGRVLVQASDEEKALKVLTRVFGIVSVSPGLKVKPSLEAIERAVSEVAKGLEGPIKIEVNRAWKGFPLKSPELARRLAKDLARIPELRGVPLDTRNPKNKIGIEIREEFAFIYKSVIPGPGGLPYGCQGKALALFSGGLDSPVASWLMAKRGLALDFLFINMYGPVLEARIYQVFKVLKPWIPKARLFSLRVPDLRLALTKIPEGYRQLVYKRVMYRLGQEIAKTLKCKALITGESLGQVSTQTLANLIAIEDAISLPVFRPLIGMDKEEIVALARRIGTYEPSSALPEYCKLEGHSRVNVPVDLARKLEARLDFDPGNLEARLVELRDLEPLDLEPKSLEGLEIVKLWEGEPRYDPSKKYLLVCDSGILAEERAYALRKEGIEAYAISRAKARKLGIKGMP